MFEKFTNLDCRDFRQRYEGTYGFFIKGGKRILVRLDSVSTEDTKQVTFSDKDGITYRLHADSDDDTVGFEFLPPKNSYHNTLNGVYLLARIPSRQYSRGICDRNTAIMTVVGHGVPVGFEILHDLFGVNPTPKETLATILAPDYRDDHSVALSSQFALQLDQHRVYCLGRPIGTAKLDKNNIIQIKLDDAGLWRQELRDCFARTQIQGNIE